MPETILITGGSGFVGGAVVRALQADRRTAGARLLLITDNASAAFEAITAARDSAGLYGFSSDDLARADVRTVDRVIHLGAITPKAGSEADNPVAAMANVVNLHRLIGALPTPPRRFVFASTLDVYGIASAGIDENEPCQPASLYGAAKLFGERWLASRFGQADFPQDGLQVLRLGHIYGPGEESYRKFIPESIRRLLAGEAPHFVTDGGELRSFLHVDDCARMIVEAAFAERTSGPINLASARSLPLRDVASILCDIHREATGRHVEPTFADAPRRGSDLTLSNARMRSLLGNERVALEAGLRGEFDHMAALTP